MLNSLVKKSVSKTESISLLSLLQAILYPCDTYCRNVAMTAMKHTYFTYLWFAITYWVVLFFLVSDPIIKIFSILSQLREQQDMQHVRLNMESLQIHNSDVQEP